MKNNFLLLILGAATFAVLLFSPACYYDNEEELYGTGGTCDTTAVRYSVEINAILANSCYLTCHAGSSPQAGFTFNSYQTLLPYLNSGAFLQSIDHTGSASPMPPGGKLDACSIEKVRSWIKAGALDN